ncbi:MAG: J domain-containing protein [Hyphomicrobiaceae bacterium]
MFERNKIDSIEHSGMAVEISTDTGETIGGQLLVGMGRSLGQVLNGEGGFIEFEPWEGERVHIAKASLRAVKPVKTTRPESLKGRLAAMDGFDPYTILGVRKGAGLEEVKRAWHRLSMAYHPDRYAAAELPVEVTEYLSAMARRVNAAYAALEPALASKKSSGHQAAPLYRPQTRA